MNQLLIFLLVFVWFLAVCADVKSTSGNIFFDVNSNDETDVAIGSTGVGIGTETASANLHVLGNSIVEGGNLYVGTSSGNSTLEIQGSIGYGVETFTQSGNISGNSMVFADTSGGNLTLRFPIASDADGRKYSVKKTSTQNILFLVGGPFDGNDYMTLTSSSVGFPYLKAVSGSGNWQIASVSGNGDLIGSDNLIGWWKLDESSGNTAHDHGPSGLTGVLHSSMTDGDWVTGKIGNALDFDATNDHVDLGTHASFNFGTKDFTISMWVKTNTAAGYKVMLGKDVSGNRDWVFGFGGTSGGKWQFLSMVDGTTEVTSATSVETTSWHHLAVTRSGTTTTLYLDGASDGSDTSSGTNYVSTNAIHIGEREFVGNLQSWDGLIDAVRMYDKALTGDEVQVLYQLGQ